MINLISAAFMIAAIGLIGQGSFWSLPCLTIAFAGFAWADAVYIDIEFMGGLLILVMIVGATLSLITPVIYWLLRL